MPQKLKFVVKNHVKLCQSISKFPFFRQLAGFFCSVSVPLNSFLVFVVVTLLSFEILLILFSHPVRLRSLKYGRFRCTVLIFAKIYRKTCVLLLEMRHFPGSASETGELYGSKVVWQQFHNSVLSHRFVCIVRNAIMALMRNDNVVKFIVI